MKAADNVRICLIAALCDGFVTSTAVPIVLHECHHKGRCEVSLVNQRKQKVGVDASSSLLQLLLSARRQLVAESDSLCLDDELVRQRTACYYSSSLLLRALARSDAVARVDCS